MRFVLLAIFVLLALQPLPVEACDMHDDQGMTYNPAGAMSDGKMGHDAPDMDCCDQAPENPGDGCGSMSHCGACPVGLAAITPTTLSMSIGTISQQYLSSTGEPLNRSPSPPFRPPIA